MEQEKGNFRGRVFGFNRRDVIDYIEELATERNMLQKENQELRERLWALEDSGESLPASEASEDDSEDVDAAREALESALSEARELLRRVKSEYDELCADVKINASHAEGELKTISQRLAGIQETLQSAGERLEEIGEKLDAREE